MTTLLLAEHDNAGIKDSTNKALKRITGEDFGFQASASPRRRENAQKKWADWWDQEQRTIAEEKKLAGKRR